MSTDRMRVLVAGGGIAALEAVLALRSLASGKVDVELLAPASAVAFKPESVLEPFGGDPVEHVSFGPDVLHHRGALAGVDVAGHAAITTDGGRLPYDRLVVCTGARAAEAVPGAVTFRGSAQAGAVTRALAAERVVFAAPCAEWTLPLYELALLAGRPARIVTPEPSPLAAFGDRAVIELLERAEIEFIHGEPRAAIDGALLLSDGRLLPADAVIALPRIVPRPLSGLPDGFLAIDEHARVIGVPDVYAAGDVTDGPIKQGGLATQQADAAAEHIAAAAGAELVPRPYRPVLRALLLTGAEPLSLGAAAKVGGRFLTPHLQGAASASR